MAEERLTKRDVDALKPPKTARVAVKVRESFVWDRELRGFGVQVMPSGLTSVVFQFRSLDRRPRRVVIGRYGLMTVEKARLLPVKSLWPYPRVSIRLRKGQSRWTVDRWRALRLEDCRGRGRPHPRSTSPRDQGFDAGDGSQPN
ncbi:MAG: DUF4102 domain-containing protein [Methylocapsa sp.]|nr:DUF4102 domain-containing protein [Methylocapsa sp.]